MVMPSGIVCWLSEGGAVSGRIWWGGGVIPVPVARVGSRAVKSCLEKAEPLSSLLLLKGFLSDETSRPTHDSFRAMPCQWKGSRVRNPLGWVSARRGSAQSHDPSRVSFVSLRFYSLTPTAQHNRVGRAGGPVPLGDGALGHLRGNSWTDGTMDLAENGLTRERQRHVKASGLSLMRSLAWLEI
ncbi:hypothetical protein CH63R_07947 [Colletotrichum higginsianum IMI 349063]|uniref:Uncharacterized protein n=1 Tax=Colletotrichum higginsianum (strain IMI 349063) TaxID=759273 RepID=A0A1B7YAT1_COLHI|nr:hypothetical protein CH63R_07947 [Colletotrichum higginsianum IMI 349063]OBR09182.1 hypothetical protein CH63R_07947 [Colletotrichum higginsianum IMI 349063]